MKNFFSGILFCCVTNLFAQNVNIPDLNFKNALLVHTPVIDTNEDGEIQVAEAEAFSEEMIVDRKNISDLTGIEAFVNLKLLSCNTNQLTSIDLSQNTALIELWLHSNQLISLDVSQNTTLEILDCRFNELTNLDVSQNTALTELRCETNQLTSLDVSQNTALVVLWCYFNTNLTTICVNSSQNTNSSSWIKDGEAEYSENCITTLQENVNNVPTLVKAYNMQGVEIPTDTKDEVIILLYDNGVTEKVIRY